MRKFLVTFWVKDPEDGSQRNAGIEVWAENEEVAMAAIEKINDLEWKCLSARLVFPDE